MRRLLIGLALAVPLLISPSLNAGACYAHCKELARACKTRCSLDHPERGPSRHRCVERCKIREHECRASCR